MHVCLFFRGKPENPKKTWERRIDLLRQLTQGLFSGGGGGHKSYVPLVYFLNIPK